MRSKWDIDIVTLKMIIGLFMANNQTNEMISRMTLPLAISRTEHFLLDFSNSVASTSGCIDKGLYKYVYNLVDSVYYVVITSPQHSRMRAQWVLDELQKNSNGDPIDALIAMDNLLYGQTLFSPNMDLIKSMDSQEEKIHELMMRSRTKEVVQKQKELQRRPVIDIDRELEKVRNLEMEIRNESIQQLRSIAKIVTNPVKERRRKFETSASPVFILFKERLKMTIDKENNIKSGEVQGDMSLMIKEDEYKNLEITLANCGKDAKFSPNLDKQASGRGVLRSERGFPVGKNVALVKWRDTEIKAPPITFTFWPSETSLNTYQIMLEYTAEHNLENLGIFFPKTHLSDIVVSGAASEGDSHIEWNVGDVEKGASDTLEFSCTCSDPSEIFPLDVYFASDFVFTGLSVSKVVLEEEIKDVEIKTVFEVDKFTVVDE